MANLINDTSQFAAVIVRWHMNALKRIQAQLDIPKDGSITANYTDEATGETHELVLQGDVLRAFHMGMVTGIDAFRDLPFTFSEPEQDEPVPDTPKSE